ncbi:MAG: hydantoinase/oxoprolinase family protein, partial [Carbonactinosporaceae bacterium]
MRDILRGEHPEASVSISAEVLREYREYERSVTTLVDAAVKPRVSHYLARISGRLAETSPRAVFSVMTSNGGMLSAEAVLERPISTVLSGPAAGVLGAALVTRAAGHERVITLDGGGTSTDVSVVLRGEPTLTTEGAVGRHPLKAPMIDIVTVGAGGGSIAWVSPEGTLKVGPRSAGAEPGPICYGRGGEEPTVTDAHAFLQRIPGRLLGGQVPLDVAAARGGIARLARTLGLSPERTARGVLEISAWNQANAIRQVTVKRGLDVRDFVAATFGGSGSLLACLLIDVLGLRGAVVPRDPGNLSAFGLLSVDVRNDEVRTHVVRDADLGLDADADADRDAPLRTLAGGYADLEERAARTLAREGFGQATRRYARSADLRYFGQAFEVRVPAPPGPVDAEFRRAVVAGFHDAHERLYGYCYR